MRVLRVFGYSLRDAYEELFLVVGLSLLWWLATVTLVGAAPATAALAAVGYRLSQEQRVNLDVAKDCFRSHFWLSWRVGLVALLSAGLLVVNILFYAQVQGVLRFVLFLFIYLALTWVAVHLYAFPLLSAMDQPNTRMVYRNAAVITFANPLFSLGILLGLALFTALSVALPFLAVIAWPAVVAIVGARALADRLEVAAQRGQ